MCLVGSQKEQELREEQPTSRGPILAIRAATGDDCEGWQWNIATC